MGHMHISPRRNSWFFMAWLLFVLSSTHGFDQSLIWESFVANVTKKIRLIYCNGSFCPWNGKKMVHKSFEGCTPPLSGGKMKKRKKMQQQSSVTRSLSSYSFIIVRTEQWSANPDSHCWSRHSNKTSRIPEVRPGQKNVGKRTRHLISPGRTNCLNTFLLVPQVSETLQGR